MSCSLQTTTSSGTFTITNDRMTRCEAKNYCKNKNQILAPITTDEDINALTELINPECDIHKGFKHYHIGLEVTACGNTQERVFSNGVAYSKELHGHLYHDLKLFEEDKKCPMAYLYYYAPKKLVIGRKTKCNPAKFKVICLDQSTASASPILQGKTDLYQFSLGQVLVAFGVFGCLVVATAITYRRNKILEAKVEVLESLKDTNE